MAIQQGKYKARHLADANQMAIEMDYLDIIGESEEFVALFKRGKSVYLPGVGSVYEPARIYFCKFIGDKEPIDSGESWVDLLILLDCPIRSR